MTQYCIKCRRPVEGESCPICGRKKLRPITGEDACFLTELKEPWSDMLAEILTQEDIPVLRQGAAGVGLAAEIGMFPERHQFFVPYACLEKVQALAEAFFSGNYAGENE